MAKASIENITKNIKEALKDKRAKEVSVLRMLLAAVKNKKISLGNKEDLSDEEVNAVVAAEIKKRKDSIVAYEDAGREDLAAKEKAEMEILKRYQPKQISDEEIENKVKETVKNLNASGRKDFGQVMGRVMADLKGRADGERVSVIVKKVLS